MVQKMGNLLYNCHIPGIPIGHQHGFPVIVSAPSGAGKTSLCAALLDTEPELKYSISTTTRPQRSNEKDGKDYQFVDDNQFKELIAKGVFAEHAKVHEHYYGTQKSIIDAHLNKGYDVLLDVDVQGGLKLKKNYPEGIFIFVLPPGFEELERRLRFRSTESEEQIKLRLRNAKDELSFLPEYDYFLVNQDFDRSVSYLKSILFAERSKVSRMSWKKK